MLVNARNFGLGYMSFLTHTDECFNIYAHPEHKPDLTSHAEVGSRATHPGSVGGLGLEARLPGGPQDGVVPRGRGHDGPQLCGGDVVDRRLRVGGQHDLAAMTITPFLPRR